MRKTLFFLYLFHLLYASSEDNDIVVDLAKPIYKDGVFSTKDGGVIYNQNFRLQARNIEYISRFDMTNSAHLIRASGDIMLQLKNTVFTADALELDLDTCQGKLQGGKTFIAPWYIGGDNLEIDSQGNFIIHNAFATTCAEQPGNWDLYAKSISIKDLSLLYARDIQFRICKVPTLWLPFYKVNLDKFTTEPIIKYKMTWDTKVGPRASFRYQIYSWKDLAVIIRGDFRLKKDYGGALQVHYLPDHKRYRFASRNYLARDILPNDPKNTRRYRYQGEACAKSMNAKTVLNVTWDKYSDIHMPNDFKSDDFEINPAKKTEFSMRREDRDIISMVHARLKVNDFESVKQDLPTAFINVKTYKFPIIDLFSTNTTKVSYLDYSYSKDLETNLPNFHAWRLDSSHEIFRPFFLQNVKVTPYIGAQGLYYSNNPENRSIGLGIIKYGTDAAMRVTKQYKCVKHIVEPYFFYHGYSRATAPLDKHFIFSIDDGLDRINQLQLGFRNILYQNELCSLLFRSKFYANAFFADIDIPQVIPKLYLDLEWIFPKLEINIYNAWNFRHQVLDFSNWRVSWTINQHLAFRFNVLYRSRYDWRKADHTNFLLDVSRKESELLNSSISDRRITLLTDIFFRFSPAWTCHIQTHHGWYRLNEPPYNEIKIDLFTLISSSWKVRFSYWHTETDNRFDVGIDLVKGK